MRDLAYKARTIRRRPAPTTSTSHGLADLDARRPPAPLTADPGAGEARRRPLAGAALPPRARRDRRKHTQLLPAREAAPGDGLDDPRPGRIRPRTCPGIDLDGSLARAPRVALAEQGPPSRVEADRRPVDPAVRQVPAVEGPRRALGSDSTDNALVRHLIDSPTEPSPTRRRRRRRRSTSTLSMRRARYPADASQLEAVAEAMAGRTFVLEGPPGHRQVADHHEPAHPGGRRGQAGAVRRREASGSRRRVIATRRGRHGAVLPWISTTRAPSRPSYEPRSSRHWTTRSTLTRKGSRPGRRTCAPVAGRWPATPSGCTRANPAGLSYYSARTAAAHPRHRRGRCSRFPLRLLARADRRCSGCVADSATSCPILPTWPSPAPTTRGGSSTWASAGEPPVAAVLAAAADVDAALPQLPMRARCTTYCGRPRSSEELSALAALFGRHGLARRPRL